MRGCAVPQKTQARLNLSGESSRKPIEGDWEEMLNRRSVIVLCACAALLAACHTPPEVGSRLPQIGLASWYGPHFQRKRTADGERFDMNALTAAHRTLPFNSYVRVTNLENGRSVIVRINDRGPFVGDRIIDLSARAAGDLGIRRNGVARVRIERVTAGRARF